MSRTVAETAAARTFRLPRLAYLIVLFLLMCAAPLAFADGNGGSRAGVGPQTLLLLLPALAAVFIARAGTRIDDGGIRIRAMFGTRHLRWVQVRGLAVREHNVYAVCSDGSVRLPCVRIADLADVSRASGGRLPAVADPISKHPPSRRPRR